MSGNNEVTVQITAGAQRLVSWLAEHYDLVQLLRDPHNPDAAIVEVWDVWDFEPDYLVAVDSAAVWQAWVASDHDRQPGEFHAYHPDIGTAWAFHANDQVVVPLGWTGTSVHPAHAANLDRLQQFSHRWEFPHGCIQYCTVEELINPASVPDPTMLEQGPTR